MKKTLYQLGMFAAIALAFTACNKEIDSAKNISGEETHSMTVTLGKDVDTKTALIEGDNASYKWFVEDTTYMSVYEKTASSTIKGKITDITLSQDQKVATLTVTFKGNVTGPYTYYARYAKEVSTSNNPKVQAEQCPGADTFDPSADILVSKDIVMESRPESLSFAMGRLVTINKMTLTGLQAGEVISSVEFSLDKHIIGYISNNSGKYECSSGGKKITLNYDATTGIVPASGSFPVYFISAPVEDAPIVSIVVTTDSNVYTKANTLTPNPFDGKSISFTIGSMTRFTMSLSGYGEPISSAVPYTLVSSQDDLFSGATYLIAATVIENENENTYALGQQNNNNRAAVSVSKNNGTILIDNTMPVYPVVIEAVTGGYTIKDETNNTYLYPASTGSNHLKGRDKIGEDNYAIWTITLSDGIASITNVGNTSRGTMAFNANNGTPIFSCYASNTNFTKKLALYVDETTMVELAEAGLAFEGVTSPINVAWADKDSFVAPTLTNPHNLPVTWSSSNESVATVQNGVISFVGNGTTTITAESEKTSQYKAGSASYQIIVSGKPADKGESADNPFTASEAIAFIQGLSSTPTDNEYYVSGIVTSVTSQFDTTYGNAEFFISDDGTTATAQFKAFRVLYLGNRKWTTGDQLIYVGDEVVICGRLTTYGSGDNLVYETYAANGTNAYNGYLVSLDKAPYYTASLSEDVIGYAGGNTITLNIGANVPWTATIDNGGKLQIGTSTAATSVSGSADTEVTVVIPQNNASSDVTYTISFTTTSNKVTVPEALTITQNAYGQAPKGTADNPYTVAEARELIDAGSGTGPTNVYVKGIISEIVTNYSSTNHNTSFNISADGATTGDQLQAFRAVASSATQYVVGDGVIMKGNLVWYKKTTNNVTTTTYELAQGCEEYDFVHMPTIAPDSGAEFFSSMEVTIDAASDTEIHYTTDGTEPTESSASYTGPFSITSTATVKAIAVKGVMSSAASSASYTKIIPVFDASLASNESSTSVEVSASTTQATIYVSGNVDWSVTASDGVTLPTPASGNGAGSFEVTFAANTSETTAKVQTVTVTTTAEVETKSITLTITQTAKPSGVDYSTVYTSNITLSTDGGSNASACKVKINDVDYDGIKAGTSSKTGAVKITVPAGTKTLYLHAAAWNNTTVTLKVTPEGYSGNIALTDDSGISGSGTTYTLAGNPSSDYYKVITFSTALTTDTALTFTASGGKRFVIWGVNN